MRLRRAKDFGDWGEAQAAAFLRRQGFAVIEHNFFTTRGEVDIVAKLRGDYYFIEVKTRRAGELATDLAVSWVKKKRLNSAATEYRYRRNLITGSFILASLMVVVDPSKKQVSFRLAAMY